MVAPIRASGPSTVSSSVPRAGPRAAVTVAVPGCAGAEHAVAVDPAALAGLPRQVGAPGRRAVRLVVAGRGERAGQPGEDPFGPPAAHRAESGRRRRVDLGLTQ